MISDFFMALAMLSLGAVFVYIWQARKRRKGAGRKAWLAAGGVIVMSVLSSATMTPAQRAAMEAQQLAEQQAEQQRIAAENATVAREQAARRAAQEAKAKAEAQKVAQENAERAAREKAALERQRQLAAEQRQREAAAAQAAQAARASQARTLLDTGANTERNQVGNAPEQEVFFANCSEARAAGYSGIRQGEPGYRSKLDRDGDGIACDR